MGLAEHMEVIVTMPSGTVSKETPSQRQALSPEKKKKKKLNALSDSCLDV